MEQVACTELSTKGSSRAAFLFFVDKEKNRSYNFIVFSNPGLERRKEMIEEKKKSWKRWFWLIIMIIIFLFVLLNITSS